MQLVQAAPAIVQRDLANTLGVIMSRTNFYIKELVNLGFLMIKKCVAATTNYLSSLVHPTSQGREGRHGQSNLPQKK